jgi:hypothetical protein
VSKKAQVDLLAKQLELKAEESQLKLDKIQSEVQKKVEKNPVEAQKKTRAEAIEICQKKITEKEAKLVRVEKLLKQAQSITKKFNRETSPVIKKEL